MVGASLAGLSAARALRAQGFDGVLTIVGDEARRPYDRPPLSKEFLAGEIDEADLRLEDDDEDLRADWRLGVAATALDPGIGAVTLADGSVLHADGVIVATGSRARRWPAATAMSGVHVLRTIDDAVALRADLRPGARLVVIGAGFIGAEVASTARKLGLDVTIVEAAATPLQNQLGARFGSVLAEAHARNGVRLICGVGIAGLTGAHRALRADQADRVTGVELTDGRQLPADTVVVGIGGAPNVEWLQSSGLTLANGVVCGSNGQTGIPNVVAVGDCAAWYDGSTATAHRVEHWTGALERPAIAAAALLSGCVAADVPVKPPYFWSDQYGARIQFAGIARPDDEVAVEEGSCEALSFLATYRRDGQLVAVLGVDQPRLFTRWRRQLAIAPASA